LDSIFLYLILNENGNHALEDMKDRVEREKIPLSYIYSYFELNDRKSCFWKSL
jgi:hypothetical protein